VYVKIIASCKGGTFLLVTVYIHSLLSSSVASCFNKSQLSDAMRQGQASCTISVIRRLAKTLLGDY